MTRQGKNPFREARKICESCDKSYREQELPILIDKDDKDVKTGVHTRIEQEVYPYCTKCFKKELQRYKKAQWMTEMIRGKFINEDTLKLYKEKKLSHAQIDKLWREYQKCQ